MFFRKTKKLFLVVSLSCLLFMPAGRIDAAIRDLSQAEWTQILAELGAKPSPELLERVAKSAETLDKINLQTRGSLDNDNWVDVFRKLNIEPKENMEESEWNRLFTKLGVRTKSNIALASTSQQQPAPVMAPVAVAPSTAPVVTQSVVAAPKPEVAPIPVPSPMPPVMAQQPSTPAPVVQPPAVPSQPVTPVAQTTGIPVASVPITPSAPPQVAPVYPTYAPQAQNSSLITLDLRGMDILSVLKIISQKSGLNIIAGSNVKGNVTLYLKDLNAIDALKMILEMNDLAYVQEDSVIKVMTAQDYERVYGKRFYDRTTVEIIHLSYAKTDNVVKTITPLKSKIGQIIADNGTNTLVLIDTPESIATLKHLIDTLDGRTDTKIFPLNYAKPKDVADKLKNSLSPGIGDIQIDERSNQLMITDTEKNLKELADLIASLDKRHREVLIEARIVQVLHNNEHNVGISWESVFSKVNDQNMPGKVVGNFSNLSALPPVVMGASGIQLSVGTLEINNFSAVLDMLQTVGKTDLVSSPRIAAIDNKEARILVGTKEAYVTTQMTNTGSTTSNPVVAESVSFVDVGMKLFVTPSIGEDGYVTMKIRPEVSSVDRILRTSQNNPIPIVRTSESETTVMVKDGISVIIAGLIEDKKIDKDEGIPLLSRIPILGYLFRRTSSSTVKSELVVFLTPHIMSGDVSAEIPKKK